MDNESRYVVEGAGRGAVRIDPTGKATTAVYDAVGQITSVTDRNGRQIDYRYDAAGRATAATWKTSGGMTVNLLTFTYDANDNVLTASDDAGTVTYSVSSGCLGQSASQISKRSWLLPNKSDRWRRHTDLSPQAKTTASRMCAVS